MVWRWSGPAPLVVSILVLSGCGTEPVHETSTLTLPAFPVVVAEWTAMGDTEYRDTDSIYGYINGHAEVYMAYGMKHCVSQRYSGPDGGDEIVVDLFEMASPADAYGVFSHDHAGETVEIGQGGVFRHGWLSFWKGGWYGSIYSSGGDESSRRAVVDVAGAVAEIIPGGGEVPDLVLELPSDGLDEATVCFLRSPQILNAHVFVGGDNVFEIGPEVEAVVARYEESEASAHLIVVRYPNEAAAEAVEDRARNDAESGADRPEMMIGRSGSILAAVVGSDVEPWGETLLAEALGGDE